MEEKQAETSRQAQKLIPLIIDTNILFSCLLGKSLAIRETLFSSHDVKPYSCKFAIVELFKHKDKLLKCSGLEEDEMLELFYYLMTKIEFYNENTISDTSLQKAYELCRDIDEKDTVLVGLTIELNGLLWTGDKQLAKGLKQKGFRQLYKKTYV